jgi:hypothetical protein
MLPQKSGALMGTLMAAGKLLLHDGRREDEGVLERGRRKGQQHNGRQCFLFVWIFYHLLAFLSYLGYALSDFHHLRDFGHGLGWRREASIGRIWPRCAIKEDGKDQLRLSSGVSSRREAVWWSEAEARHVHQYQNQNQIQPQIHEQRT